MSASTHTLSPQSETNPEIASLLTLLDDPDAEIAGVVQARLRTHGTLIVSPLIEFAKKCCDTVARERAYSLAKELNEEVLIEEFKALRTKIE